MYIPSSLLIVKTKKLEHSLSTFGRSLNLANQAVNCSMLLARQANYTSLFNSLYSGLNRTGWRNIYDIQRNVGDPSQFQRLRNAGVRTGWRYEKASIMLGGKGSANWTRSERIQIMQKGRVAKAQGHHQLNVHDHPDFMAEASNIKFYRSLEEHLQDGHGGNFRNESNKPFIDKDRMLIRDYESGLLRHEITAAGFAALIGFATSASISMVIEIANQETYKAALGIAVYNGLKGSVISSAYYAGFRFGEIGIDKAVTALGTRLSPQLARMLKSNGGKLGLLGGTFIFTDAVWQTRKDLNNGMLWNVALTNTVKKEALPVGLLALSIYNPPIGIVGSLLAMGYEIGKIAYDRNVLEKVEIHRINHLYQVSSSKL